MLAHPSTDVAHRLWLAIAEGDAAALREVVAPDIDWWSAGHNPLARRFRGVDKLLAYLAEVGEAKASLVSTLEGILVDETGAAICHRVTATHGRRKLDLPFMLRLWIADGRVVRAVSVPFDQQRNDAFWNRVQ